MHLRLLRFTSCRRIRLEFRDIRTPPTLNDRVRLSIAFSKTTNHHVLIDLARRNDELCPRWALASYIPFLTSLRAIHLDGKFPLFTASQYDESPLSDSVFISRFRSALTAARSDINASHFAGHSFRRGGATALYLAKVNEADIKRHGRWKSEAV